MGRTPCSYLATMPVASVVEAPHWDLTSIALEKPRSISNAGATTEAGAGVSHLPRMALAVAYNAFPCAVLPFTAQKPVMPSCLRAFLTASKYFLKPADIIFLALAELALLTTLPCEFFIKESLVRPPPVFSFVPRK